MFRNEASAKQLKKRFRFKCISNLALTYAKELVQNGKICYGRYRGAYLHTQLIIKVCVVLCFEYLISLQKECCQIVSFYATWVRLLEGTRRKCLAASCFPLTQVKFRASKFFEIIATYEPGV